MTINTKAITSVSGKNNDGTNWTLKIGDKVEIAADDSDPDSSDEGHIVGFPSQAEVDVSTPHSGIVRVNIDSVSAV